MYLQILLTALCTKVGAVPFGPLGRGHRLQRNVKDPSFQKRIRNLCFLQQMNQRIKVGHNEGPDHNIESKFVPKCLEAPGLLIMLR
jgi:hypothetical protein